MAYNTGRSRPIDEITLADILENPIWEYALDEEGIDGQDESWIRPIIDTHNVIEEIDSPIIALTMEDSVIYGFGEYDHETENIVGISVCIDSEWKALGDSELSTPIVFISVPKIDNVESIVFICTNLENEEAFRD